MIMDPVIFTKGVPPERKRWLARELLEAVKDKPTEEKPAKQLVMIDDITCKPELVYNPAAIIKLCEAIIAANDKTLLAIEGMELGEIIDKFVFSQ